MFSHQIRNPLTAITGYVSLLREGTFGSLSNEQDEILQVISKNVRRVNMLLDDYKDLEHIEANDLSLSKCLVPVPEVLEQIVQELSSVASEKGVTLNLEIEQGIKFFVDVDAIKRVFLHIIFNSINYTQSGVVNVKAYNDGKWSVVVVKDTGIGIDDEDRANIFKKYYRSSNPYVRENPGAGVGLYIARAHVISHGGSIEIEGAPGKGTVATVKLPVIPN